ncbi:MAG: relaxase domain-containing protein, partial [Sulfurimonas sp.]|nr:relaxase domain-containing protein [Sulfurimonas sp.]
MKIASISSSSAKNYYYEKDPIFNNNQEGNNLEWHGKLSEHFGLKGSEVTPEEFSNLLEGKDPQGTQLLNRAANTTNGSENAIFDAPLSAPKSISILALNHDSRLIEAHEKAVQSTIEKLESDYAKVRGFEKQEDGSSQRVSRDSNNLLIASAKHSVSRATEGNAPDPSLHSHVLAFNMSFDQKDNKFKALDASDLFKDQRLINQVYKSELAKEVTNLGYAIEQKAYGNFDIKMDQEIIDNFSKRHMEIKGTMQDRGLESVKDEVYIQHTLKSEKKDYDSIDLKKNWSEQLKGLDIEGAKSFKELANSAKSTDKGFQFKNEKEVLEKAASLLSENEAKFSKKDLLLNSSRISLGQFSINDLEKELNNVNKTGQTYGSAIKKVDDKTFTTKSMHMIERSNIRILKNQVQSEPIMSDKVAHEMIDKYEAKKGFSLTHGQRTATKEFLSSKSQFIAIQGNSGVGKTTMLDSLRMANEEQGSKVSIEVLAPTGKAALEAKEASGLKASTVDSFLMRKSEDSKKDKIYVVDETSMLDTKKANQLLKRAESEGSRVFFLGDSKQLSSVGAGDFFNQLKQNTQTVEVTQSLRQKNDIQKEIVAAASKKD